MSRFTETCDICNLVFKASKMIYHSTLSFDLLLRRAGEIGSSWLSRRVWPTALIETQNGEWWIVLLARRPYYANHSNIGRETFLAPVSWVDGWPHVGRDGTLERTYAFPNIPESQWVDDHGCGTEDAILLSTQTSGSFVGAYVGLFASTSQTSPARHALFHWFRYESHDEQ